jgi:large subunit ribosomal protein L1
MLTFVHSLTFLSICLGCAQGQSVLNADRQWRSSQDVLATLLYGTAAPRIAQELQRPRTQTVLKQRNGLVEMHRPGVKRRPKSRRTIELKDLRDKDKRYTVEEAIELAKKGATTKFVESLELHGNLNLNPKYNDQQIRTTVSLPKGSGKTVRVAVLAEGPLAEAAEAAGADKVGMTELIEEISAGNLDFDILLATPPAMPKLAKLGKMLGPKGLMPSPKAGTVTTDPAEAVAEFKGGKLEFRTDKTGNIHLPVGKIDFSSEDLAENIFALVDAVDKNKPSGAKAKLWKGAVLASSMGPGIKVDLDDLRKHSE